MKRIFFFFKRKNPYEKWVEKVEKNEKIFKYMEKKFLKELSKNVEKGEESYSYALKVINAEIRSKQPGFRRLYNVE